MDQGGTARGLSWLPDVYDIGFTLTLSEGLTPYEPLRRVGAEERHIVPLIRAAARELLLRREEDHISDLDFLDREDEAAAARLTHGGFLPAPPRTIVRAGSVADWAYALEEIHWHAGTRLAELSRRGRAFCVDSNAKGFTRVEFARHAELLSSFEPGLPHLASGVPAEEALGFVHHGGEPGHLSFLRFLEGALGLDIPWEETESELPSAAFT
ncbi:hypothetical protein ACIPSE_27740 [Streptomyces sp. NPDC090106]|uniref:hypothetical protein n=1 Tax=Streptomyces sp. NPDC090106 TaxID=3365946 RepID=UPI00382C15C5